MSGDLAHKVPACAAPERAREMLAALPAKQRAFLRLRFGEGRTVTDAGAALGLSREGARQMEKRCLRRLARPCGSARVYTYADPHARMRLVERAIAPGEEPNDA